MNFSSLSLNHTKWSNIHKQFACCCQQNVWVCFTILWGWRLKGSNVMKFIKLKYIFTFAFYNYLAWNNVAQILKYTWVWIGVWTWRIGIANCFNTTFRFRLRYWLRLRPHPWIMPFSRSNIFCSCSSYHIWTFRSRFIWFLFYSIFWFTFPAYFFFFFFTFFPFFFTSQLFFTPQRMVWRKFSYSLTKSMV